jgi:bifunctional DNase/RNase
MKEIEVKIYSIITNLTESIVFLDEVNGIRIIPIWIGPFEAQAIALKMSGYTSPRPMTHDLLYRIITKLGGKVKKVVISDLIENTFFAKIYIEKEGNLIEIDSRPSDAIALAVRCGCSIYINEEIFESTQVMMKPITDEEVKEFKEKLKNMTSKDIIGDHPTKYEKEKDEENQEKKNDIEREDKNE